MATADPTYPLLPIACILSAVMLLLVLFRSFIRQSWNLGVAFLCFWLFFENFTSAINTIIWSDNAEIKLYVYCDIVSHLQLITFITKPMATLIISRRLYLIADLRSVQPPSKAARRWDLLIEWTLGLVIPLIIAGPLYYIDQGARFKIIEGFGCSTNAASSIFFYAFINSWTIIPPLLSITIYYPRVAWIFYQRSRDVNNFLQSNDSVSRTSYFRILALASVDLLLSLPFGAVNMAFNITQNLNVDGDVFSFYPGWTLIHSQWGPTAVSYAELQASGVSTVAGVYFTLWTSPVLALTIFGLFGLTAEARASYRRTVCIIGGWFGWKSTSHERKASSPMDTMEFGARPQGTISIDAEMSMHPPNLTATESEIESSSGSGTREQGVKDLDHCLDADRPDKSHRMSEAGLRRSASEAAAAEPAEPDVGITRETELVHAV